MTYYMFQGFIFTKICVLENKTDCIVFTILCVNSLLKRNAVTALLLNPCAIKANSLICK